MAGRTRPAPSRQAPERTCVACRTARPKRELIRVVRAPDGTVSIDVSGRAPGRGAYLCRDASCWDTAARKRALEHALKTPIPAGLLAGPARWPGGPDEPPTTTTSPRADGPRPSPNPDPMPRGDAHGQE